MVSSTLPELLDEHAALAFIDAGVPAVAGLRTGLACAAARSRPRRDPARLREIAAARRRAPARPPQRRTARAGFPSMRPRSCSAAASLPVVDGRLVSGEDDAAVALAELGGHVAVKLSAPSLQHKADVGALFLDVRTEDAVRAAHRDLAGARCGRRRRARGANGAARHRAARGRPRGRRGAVSRGRRRRRVDRGARRRGRGAAARDARAGGGGAPHPARGRALHRRPRPPGA